MKLEIKPILFALTLFVGAAIVIPMVGPLRGRVPDFTVPPQAAYLGFDRDVYPGDSAFATLRKTFSFTSYWLGPPPGEKTTTWVAKRDFLRRSGFGFLVLYRGRETREFKKDGDGAVKGMIDAQNAVAAAKKEGFPAHTIIFLDIEEGGRLPQAYHDYLHTWFEVLASSGYRAGVYCSGMPAKEPGGVTVLTADDIRTHAENRQFEIFVYNDACPPSPGCSFPATAPLPSGSGVNYAQIWQYAQSPRRKEFTASCPAGYHANGGCYSPLDAGEKWDLDMDSAWSTDPSHGATP
jgi:hypothetical protein